MNAQDFFYLVAHMRECQRDYFKTRDNRIFRQTRAIENEVDREIARVKGIIHQREQNYDDIV